MQRIFYSILSFILWSVLISAAHAHGAMAIGVERGTVPARYRFIVTTNHPTREDATNEALRKCNAIFESCMLGSIFQNSFIAVSFATYPDDVVHVYSENGLTSDDARANAVALCPTNTRTCSLPTVFEDNVPGRTRPLLQSPVTSAPSNIPNFHTLSLREKLADIASDIYSRIEPALVSARSNPFFWTTVILFGVCGAVFFRFKRLPNRLPETSVAEDTPSPPLHSVNADPLPPSVSPIVVPETAYIPQDLPPGQPIALKLKRTQKQAAMGGLIYMLDARIDVSAEVRSLIAQHRLGSRLIYESEARQKHAEKAKAHLDGSRDGTSIFAPPSAQAMGLAKTFWKLGRAAVSAARASLALRVTVDSLLAGVHVECKDMDELLEAEDAFREAKQNLEGYIASLRSFDGREEII